MKCPKCENTKDFTYDEITIHYETTTRTYSELFKEFELAPHTDYVESAVPVEGKSTCRSCGHEGVTKEFDDGDMPDGYGCAVKFYDKNVFDEDEMPE
ncbi:MAG: hypothetical protein V2I33_16355 [Kangiellaceae bacterium]|jgi:hypothetical protein|nr:hypothetical protein [Kangiellaceae bacterium]